MPKFYAMLSSQGTACAETTLREDDYTEENRKAMEVSYCFSSSPDKPVFGTWTDVSENDACRAMYEGEES